MPNNLHDLTAVETVTKEHSGFAESTMFTGSFMCGVAVTIKGLKI